MFRQGTATWKRALKGSHVRFYFGVRCLTPYDVAAHQRYPGNPVQEAQQNLRTCPLSQMYANSPLIQPSVAWKVHMPCRGSIDKMRRCRRLLVSTRKGPGWIAKIVVFAIHSDSETTRHVAQSGAPITTSIPKGWKRTSLDSAI